MAGELMETLGLDMLVSTIVCIPHRASVDRNKVGTTVHVSHAH